VPYVIERVRKSGVRYTAVYADENGRRKSAGTYDTEERAQAVAVRNCVGRFRGNAQVHPPWSWTATAAAAGPGRDQS
jgi:hypothetical protein